MSNIYKVLDHGSVELIDHMGNDLSVVNAARVSFGKATGEFAEKDRKLLRYLLNHKHTSPLRHCQMSFRVKAPIFVLRQWMKHRIASEFNEISSRYVELGFTDFYTPDQFRSQSLSDKQGSGDELPEDICDIAFVAQSQALSSARASYTDMRDNGVAKEMARMVMPVSQYSEVIWTVSLEAALHFLTLRLDSHAQWEIQQYAIAIRSAVAELYPAVVIEYEAHQRRQTADKRLALTALSMALADVAFEVHGTEASLVLLNSVRGELRDLVSEYADCYSDELGG